MDRALPAGVPRPGRLDQLPDLGLGQMFTARRNGRPGRAERMRNGSWRGNVSVAWRLCERRGRAYSSITVAFSDGSESMGHHDSEIMMTGGIG